MAKKKIKDCTIEEIRRFCKTIEVCDGNCPLSKWLTCDVYCLMYIPSELELKVLEKEIEIPEEGDK